MRVSKAPEERKAELIAAARRLFDEKGVEKTRVSDIVGSINVAQGVFYYYFRSKEEMVNAVVQQVTRELEAKLMAIRQDKKTGFYQKVHALIELYLELIDQFTSDSADRLTIGEGGLPAEDPLTAHTIALWQEYLLELVQQGAKEGHIKALYPRESALVGLYGLHRLAADKLPSRRQVYAIAEQVLCMPQNSLMELNNRSFNKGV